MSQQNLPSIFSPHRHPLPEVRDGLGNTRHGQSAEPEREARAVESNTDPR